MSCRRVKELIPLHVEGDLSPRRARAVEAHLHRCEGCRRLEAEQRESQAWLRSSPAPELDEAFHEDVRRAVWRRIEEERRPAPGSALRWISSLLLRPAAVAGAAALVALAALIALRLPVPPSVQTATREPERVPPAPTAVAAAISPAPVLESRPHEPAPGPRRRHRRTRRAPVALLADAGEPVRIEMQTPNPNVRIIWLAANRAEN